MDVESKLEHLERKVYQLEAELAEHSSKTREALTTLRQRDAKLQESISGSRHLISNINKAIESMRKRVDALSPRFVEDLVRRLAHIEGHIIPTHQKMIGVTEINQYLKAADVPDNKQAEFHRAWCWAIDNMDNIWWARTKEYTIDQLLGHIVGVHREFEGSKP